MSDNSFTPEPKDPSKHQQRQIAPGAAGDDPADNPRYDKNLEAQNLDSEILKRRRIGRFMSIAAVVLLTLFTVTFFFYAILYANRFIKLYIAHIHQWVPANSLSEIPSVLPLVVPMIPATFFSLLGLATMVTAMRFVSAYVNSTADVPESDSVIERIAREVGGIIRTARGAGE